MDKTAILRVLRVIGAAMFWYPPAQALISILTAIIEQDWDSFAKLYARTPASHRRTLLRASRDRVSAEVMKGKAPK